MGQAMAVDLWRGYRRPSKGDIPKGWKVKRLREIASFAAGGRLGLTMSDFKDSGFPAYSAEGMTGFVEPIEFTGPAVIVSSIGEKCGKCFYAETEFTTLANVQVVFPNRGEIDPYYLWNLLNDARFWPRAQTAQPFIRPSDIKKSWIPIPGNGEQPAISEILRLADQAIDTTQKELLAAQRLKTALMQQLLTKGIPGRHKTFKRSKWVNMPSSWGIKPLYELADVTSGFTMGRDLSRHKTVTVPYVTVINVQDGFFNLSNIGTVQIKESELQTGVLKPNDVLMTEGGDRDKLGRGAIWTGQIDTCAYQNHIFRVRFRSDEYFPKVFHYLIQCWQAKRYFFSHAKQTNNLCTINSRELKRFPIGIPDPDEQEEIVEILDRCDDGLFAITKKIETLMLLKKSLLQNLLTGKVRVTLEAQA